MKQFCVLSFAFRETLSVITRTAAQNAAIKTEPVRLT